MLYRYLLRSVALLNSNQSLKIMFNAAKVCGLSSQKPQKVSFHNTNGNTNSNESLNSSVVTENYEEAIKALNSLQSNALTIKKSVLNKITPQVNNLHETVKYLNRSGISLDQLDKLSVIHVSGTKGKGSTCVLTESILRSFGVNTGFFSSPHLISVTERFRINSTPISQDKFTTKFWKVYNLLKSQKENDDDMPAYFKFLTILCFHIFLEENVDVAIIEVGIGGKNDCTNVLRNTKTVGITSLGLEHTNLLGNTIQDIAWQKAGIIKNNSNCFTTTQPDGALNVIKERAKEKHASLFVVPDLSEYKWKKYPKLQISSKVQALNASLAIQLAYDWLRQNKLIQLNGLTEKVKKSIISLETSEKVIDGLENCFWPGRCQIIDFYKLRIYLDGAHTLESVDICIDWFKNSTKESKTMKLLIFNTTGDRDSEKLLKLLHEKITFKKAYFVPNIPYDEEISDTSDNKTFLYTNEIQLQRSRNHSVLWQNISKTNLGNSFNSVLEALQSIDMEFQINSNNIEILVTGSLHLIGATVLALEKLEKNKCKNL